MKYYLLIINIITLIIYGIDKYKSIKNKYRISENTLIILAILGGVGAFLGMIIFHHKTKKKKFIILIPIIMLIWVYILINL